MKAEINTNTHLYTVFPLNIEGINDSGYAGYVANTFFPEILDTGGNKLGEMLSRETDKTIYCGIVCYSRKDIGKKNDFELGVKLTITALEIIKETLLDNEIEDFKDVHIIIDFYQ